MQVVIVSQMGIIDEVYTINAFMNEVNSNLDHSTDETINDKFTDLDEAIEWYVETAYADDCLTVDVMEVIE